MHSTTDISQYPKASCLSKKWFHHWRLYSKAYKLTFNGRSKILWTATITKISFCVVRNTYNKFFFHDSNHSCHCLQEQMVRRGEGIFPENFIEVPKVVQKIWKISLSILAIFINFHQIFGPSDICLLQRNWTPCNSND